MSDFVEAARLDEIPVGTSTTVMVADKAVALFNVDGQIYAIDDICPHAGSSLGNGKLDGRIVTCRSHGMKIDVITGCFPASTGFAVASYPVMVVAGKIMVALNSLPVKTGGAESG
ncbi:MAG TPA: Rieske 2Fe-2S domain-containing protein [Terriglobales bacterium]|nr:Rieske 2Fe-2S domain-containing protein [Terriglobales bacterium]